MRHDLFVRTFRVRSVRCVAAVAATAAGVYHHLKMYGDGEKRTPVNHEPVQVQAMEPVLDQARNLPKDLATTSPPVRSTETPQDQATTSPPVRSTETPLAQSTDQLKVSLAEAEQALESITQLQGEKTGLMHQVTTLRTSVQRMRKQLAQTNRMCDELTKECKQKQEAHTSLLFNFDEIKIELEGKEELLEVSLAEAEQRRQKALESITQLQGEKMGLMHQVTTLRTSVQKMRKQLIQTNRMCYELTKECAQEREAHTGLLFEFEEMKKTLAHKEELLEVFLAKAQQKHPKALESITQLEEEKSGLIHQLQGMRASVQEMGATLANTHRQCNDLTVVSLAEAEQRHQKALESITQLQGEKTGLMHQVTTLRTSVEMRKQLAQSHGVCDELTKECAQEQEAHISLLFEFEEMKKAFADKEELLEVSLAEAEQRRQKALESITQLQGEKTGLMHQVTTLRTSVQKMRKQLAQTNRMCYELTNECAQEREAHTGLLFEFEEMKKTFAHKEELLEVFLAKAQQKHPKALESITQLEEEKSGLIHQLQGMRASVQEMGATLANTHRQCNDLTVECERLRQARRVLPMNR